MKLFGIESNGIIFSIGISIVLCSAVTYYCHMRVKNVEVALMKQNQVLTSFISNVQNEIRKGTLRDENKAVMADVSSPEARDAVKKIESAKNTMIEVSDDSAEESDDESEEDSGAEDSDSEEDDESGIIKIGKDNIKFIDINVQMISSFNEHPSTNKIIELTDLEEITNLDASEGVTDTEDDLSEADASEADASEADASEADASEAGPSAPGPSAKVPSATVPEPISLKEIKKINLETSDDITLINLVDSGDFIKKMVKTESKETNIHKMKVDDLREMAVLKGRSTAQDVKKLKKPELIALLSDN